MQKTVDKTIVIALGGSIVYPNHKGIDTVFLGNFHKFILKLVKRGMRFIIVMGGGHVARLFQTAAHKVVRITDEDKDWLGIHATRLNAHLLRTIFRRSADPVVIDTRRKIKKIKYAVTIAAGWHPGWSTDYVAAVLAHDFNIGEFVIAGKPVYVYNKDPHKHDGAKPLIKISWKEYRKLISQKWKPGLHSPVDPIAAEFSEKHRLRAVVLNGKNLKNLETFLNGGEFKGTVIG